MINNEICVKIIRQNQRLKIGYGEVVEIAFLLDNDFKVNVLLILIIVFYIIIGDFFSCFFLYCCEVDNSRANALTIFSTLSKIYLL